MKDGGGSRCRLPPFRLFVRFHPSSLRFILPPSSFIFIPSMSSKPFKIDVSPRIQRLPPYLFGRINKMKYEKRVAGVDIIDLGMGNPTDPTPQVVVDRLAEAATDPRNHRYSVSNGIAGIRKEV